MNFFQKTKIAVLLLSLCSTPLFADNKASDSASKGKAYADLRLRYENVSQDNPLATAKALTLRTKLGYKTQTLNNFNAVIELEDSRSVFGINDYSVPPTTYKTGQYSVIADPKSTELDQAFVQYKNKTLTAKLGRQVITLDNHRFVGHVGWRQDRQTFDGLRLIYKVSDSLKLDMSQLLQRNRIFADAKDLDSSDTLLNLAYQTKYGKLTAYGYLLDADTPNLNQNDTFGLRFNGKNKFSDTYVSYLLEFASQEINNSVNTNYLALEAVITFSNITAKLGYESLGSDNATGAFQTPLATLHKFNGWTDQFLATPKQGLNDTYVSISGKFAGGKWSAIYHDFAPDIKLENAADLGSEVDLVYTRKFRDNYYSGIKLGDYSAASPAFNKVDTRKIWAWFGFKF